MRLLSETDVAGLIDPLRAIACAEAAYVQQAVETTSIRGRLDLRRATPKAGVLVVAGFADDRNQLMVKSNCHGWPQAGEGRATRSILTLWDMASVRPVALLSAEAFNDHRTAAGLAAAAKVLARPEASTLAVFGAGKMALPAMCYLKRVRPLRRIVIASRSHERAQALALRAATMPEFADVRIEAECDPGQAVSQADIIAAITTSDSPVFPGRRVPAGALVILGGANRPQAREADDELIRRATIYTDHTEGALAKAGDLVLPLEAGVIQPDAIAGEIGALIATRQSPAPLSSSGVYVFKSIGIAPQDVLLARELLARAESGGAGIWFDTDGSSAPEYA